MKVQDQESINKVQIDISNFEVRYNRIKALKINRLLIEGTIIAVVGHNGSGKSTLIKSLLELIKPSSGSITSSYSYHNKSFTLVPKDHMAFSPENGSVFEDISVESYIRLWCDIKLGDKNFYKNKGSFYIEKLGLRELFPKIGRELSKGQRRRVQTAAGFMCSPKLFLFDEPFDGLDISQSNNLSNLMLESSKKMCFVLSSHRMEVVERVADLIIVLKNGEVYSHGNLDTVCDALSGVGICIRTVSGDEYQIENLVPILKKQFNKALINQVGNQIVMSGEELRRSKVFDYLVVKTGIKFVIEKIRPSLIDAMQFHLENNKFN